LRDEYDTARYLNAVTTNKLDGFVPYQWQHEWLDASLNHNELMIRAANRVGKTQTAAIAVAWHLTGLYPDWYDGKRFDRPTTCWAAGITNESVRDIIQTQLLGGMGEDLGTGWIPRRLLVGTPSMRQAGVRNCVDRFEVRHESGDISVCALKTYEMTAEKFQGAAVDCVWLDEEPREYEIFTESLTRTLSTGGLVFVTFTPLQGHSQLVEHFAAGGPGLYTKTATWDDAPHLDEAQKKRMWESYPAHERDARTKGLPKLGEGSVFAHLIDECIIPPCQLGKHWVRIKSLDFGIGHPTGAVAIAYSRTDGDTIYVYSDYRRKGASVADNCEWLNSFDRWAPIAWPHDGENRQPQSGKTLAQLYRDNGASMMSKSARYPKTPGEKERGGTQPTEPIVTEVLERMGTGRLKIFSTCTSLIEEMRDLHRRDGKIVAVRDDVWKALSYAIMMKRYAVAESYGAVRPRYPQQSIMSSRL
jgi:phage terminase large subunit-like protein